MKRSPFLKTYIALVVLAGLGAYAYFVESKKPASSESKPKEKALVFNKPKVSELQLAPAGSEPIRLVKEGDAWKLVAPMSAPADANEADSILNSLENLEMDEVVTEAPGDLTQFGLAEPKNTVSLHLEGVQEPLKLLIGEKTPDGGSLYAKLPDKPRVFTIASYLESSFNKKPFDLRDRDVLHVKRDAVKGLEITGPDESYALQRNDKGEWTFTKPLATLAGRWSVDGLLGTLENLKMESVAAEEAKDLKPFGLVKPVRTVKLNLADGGYKILEIGSSAGEKKFHAREASSKLVAVVPGAVVDDLAKGMKELRQKRVADVATYDVEGVEITNDGKQVTLERSTTKDKDNVETQNWKRTAPDKKDLDRSKVDDALFKLTGLEVQEFIDKPQAPPAYGLDAPAAKVTLKMTGGKPPVTLEFGRKDAAVYARRPGDASILKLDAPKVDEALNSFGVLASGEGK
jgi:hypothetical protein